MNHWQKKQAFITFCGMVPEYLEYCIKALHYIRNFSDFNINLFCSWFGLEKKRHVLVMELLGLNLMELLHFCDGRFSLKTVCMLAVQVCILRNVGDVENLR